MPKRLIIIISPAAGIIDIQTVSISSYMCIPANNTATGIWKANLLDDHKKWRTHRGGWIRIYNRLWMRILSLVAEKMNE